MLIAKYTCFEAYKRKLLLLHAIVVIACVLIALYARSISITESEASYIIFYAGSVRFCSAFVLGVYLILTESRNWEATNIQNILALPINRLELLLGKVFGYLGVAVLMVIFISPPLLLVVDWGPGFMWLFALLLELLIVMLVSIMLTVLFYQPIFAVVIFSVVYVYMRVAQEFYTHAQNILMDSSLLQEQLLAWPIKVSAFLVPHFSRFADSIFMVYPHGLVASPTSLGLLILQTVLYGTLLFCIALAALRKRAF